MQATASHGLLEFFTFWLFTGSSLLGLPPGDRDPALVKAVPPQTLIYMEWASRGPGKPGAAGVDGFVADPEIRQFLDLFAAALAKRETVSDDDSLQELRSELPQLTKLLASHSGCLFAGFEPPAPNKPGVTGLINILLGAHGGLILNGGDDADAIWSTLNQSLRSVPDFVYDPASPTQSIPLSFPGYKLVMHRQGTRIIFALGSSTLPRILEGLAGRQPGLDTNPRFKQAVDRVEVPRVATLAWIDGQGILTGATASLGPLGAIIRPVLSMVGVDALDHIVQTAGVENDTMIQRTFVATGGRTDGIFVVAAGQPIQAQHFAHIPADSDLVVATSINLKKVYQEVRRLLATAQPMSVRVFDEAVKQLEKELEMNIVNDVLPAFGDVITAFDSPSAGGMIATSLVVCLEVRDAPKAALVFNRLMKLVDQSIGPDHGEQGEFGQASLQQQKFLGSTIFYVSSNGSNATITPTFCMTDRHLLFAIHPQAMKAQLRNLQAKRPGFDQVAAQKFPMPNGDVLSYAYLNGPRSNTLMASILPFAGRAMLNRLESSGVSLDSFSIPSAAAIAPYFGDSGAVVVRQKDGLSIETRNAPPVAITLALLSAYRSSRSTDFEYLEEARRRKANDPDQVQLGPVDGQVVPARAEVKAPAAAETKPAAVRQIAPLLKALVPNELQQMIPESALRRLDEGSSPDAAQRRDDAKKRRDDRRLQRRGIAPGPTQPAPGATQPAPAPVPVP